MKIGLTEARIQVIKHHLAIAYRSERTIGFIMSSANANAGAHRSKEQLRA